MFSIFFPPQGNFGIDAGPGDGGDHLGPKSKKYQISQKSQKKQIGRTKIVYTSGTFFKKCQNIYIFRIRSDIKKTQFIKPTNALNITIYNTNHTSNTKIHPRNSIFSKISNINIFQNTFKFAMISVLCWLFYGVNYGL